MKRIILSIFVALALILCVPLSSHARSVSTKIERTFQANDSIALEAKGQVFSLDLLGSAQMNEGGFVRIILEDIEGHEFLVYENVYLDEKDANVNITKASSIETQSLDGIVPQTLRIYLKKASLSVDRMTCATEKPRKAAEQNNKALFDSLMVERWNEYNRRTGTPWIAAQTSLSKLPYAKRKGAMGIISDERHPDGLEYYYGGIFVFKDYDNEESSKMNSPRKSAASTSPYVESFDWRNRHGKNWMTSVKNQTLPVQPSSIGNGGCWAFGTCAALEAGINTHYNLLLSLDLSEQELGSCGAGHLNESGNPHGGWAHDALFYTKNHGLVSEICFPFGNNDTIPCQQKCNNPDYICLIDGYQRYQNVTYNSLKNALINHGPCPVTIYNNYYFHVMCLCGYNIVNTLDTIQCYPMGAAYDTIIVSDTSQYIGQEYFIFKNSYGLEEGNGGYMYAIFKKQSMIYDYNTIVNPHINTLADIDINVSDDDNDGYYFWGVGNKPAHCPVCTPDAPDSDDSNAAIGPMDSYGNPLPYSFPYDTVYINSNIVFATDTIICGNMVVQNNATLTVTANLIMNPAAKIFVKGGGHLVVDGGIITNSKIKVYDYGKLTLKNNATLKQHRNGDLNITTQGLFNMEYGNIELIQ